MEREHLPAWRRRQHRETPRAPVNRAEPRVRLSGSESTAVTGRAEQRPGRWEAKRMNTDEKRQLLRASARRKALPQNATGGRNCYTSVVSVC